VSEPTWRRVAHNVSPEKAAQFAAVAARFGVEARRIRGDLYIRRLT
jgi:hypothetical protein